MEGGKAAGVKLRPRGPKAPQGEVVRARLGVVSNASVWDTQKLLPPGVGPTGWRQQAAATPQVGASAAGIMTAWGMVGGSAGVLYTAVSPPDLQMRTLLAMPNTRRSPRQRSRMPGA
jgi:hypothetical protein